MRTNRTVCSVRHRRPRKKTGRSVLLCVSFCVALVCMASDSITLMLVALGALGLVAILSED